MKTRTRRKIKTKTKTKTKSKQKRNRNKRRKLQYGRGTEEEEDEVNKIKDMLQARFGPLAEKKSMSCQIVYDKNKNYKMYLCGSETSNGGNECFSMNLIRKNIMWISALKYPNMKSCTISGPVILTQLYFFARDLNLDKIQLDDSSCIVKDTGALELASYYRLLHGYSWYNKYGYYTSDTNKERDAANDRRNISLQAFHDQFERRYRSGQLMKDITEFINITNEKIHLDMSVGDMMKILDAKLKSDPANYSEIIKLYKFIQFDVDLRYDNKLTLVVDDEDTKRIYDNIQEK